MPDRAAGSPKLSGSGAVHLKPGSRVRAIYQRQEVQEEYFCNYEVNPQYESQLEAAGLIFAARGPRGEVRAVELPGHRFFLATLFQPQLSSSPVSPHPVVVAFLRAAAEFNGTKVGGRRT